MHEVDTYNSEQTPEVRKLFIHMGDILQELVPEATQGLSYAMPCFLYKGKGLMAVLVTKKFLSLYPYSGKTVATLEHELKDFECTTGSIHLSLEKPIPDSLLRKIIQTRVQEIDLKK